MRRDFLIGSSVLKLAERMGPPNAGEARGGQAGDFGPADGAIVADHRVEATC